MTTHTTITTSQIEALRHEAAAAGDLKQVAICERALNGSQRARRECARVIAAAEAQQDEDTAYTVRPLGGTLFDLVAPDGTILARFSAGVIDADGQWIETEDLEEAARRAADIPSDAPVRLP